VFLNIYCCAFSQKVQLSADPTRAPFFQLQMGFSLLFFQQCLSRCHSSMKNEFMGCNTNNSAVRFFYLSSELMLLLQSNNWLSWQLLILASFAQLVIFRWTVLNWLAQNCIMPFLFVGYGLNSVLRGTQSLEDCFVCFSL